MTVTRLDYDYFPDDPKQDTCLWPASLKLVTLDLLRRYPITMHFEITKDTSKKEFKSVSAFQRFGQISKEINKSFLLSSVGPLLVKFLYDGSGSIQIDWNNSDFLMNWTTDASDLKKVAAYMNTVHGKAYTKNSDLPSRVTLAVPPVLNIISEYKSIPRTT